MSTWIPVDSGLPLYGDKCIVTVEQPGGARFVFTRPVCHHNGRWTYDTDRESGLSLETEPRVVAWMPWPEPYLS